MYFARYNTDGRLLERICILKKVPTFIVMRFDEIIKSLDDDNKTHVLHMIHKAMTENNSILVVGAWEDVSFLSKTFEEILDLLDGYLIQYVERSEEQIDMRDHEREWLLTKLP